MGEMLTATERAKGAAAGGKKDSPRGPLVLPRDTEPTLADLGLTKRESADAQLLAELSTAEFEKQAALPFLEEEAKERQRLSEGRGRKGPEKIPDLNDDHGEATEKVADQFHTNTQYVYDVKKLRDEAPDLLELVKHGRLRETLLAAIADPQEHIRHVL
jgi:hypothetical protein